MGDFFNFSLRDYQIDLINKIRQSFINKYNKPLVVLPCGGGKTVIITYIAHHANKKNNSVLFLVHRKELLDQTYNTFKKANIDMTNIHIGMVQSTANKIKSLPKYDLIIFDEAHHSTSATWLKIINNQPNAKIIGLTATPCRLDGSPLGAIYDNLIIGIEAEDLILNGYLAQYKYFAPTVTDLSNIKMKGKDFDQTSVAQVLSTTQIFGDIIQHYKKIANGLQAICYAPTRAYSKEVAEAFNQNNINAVHFDSETPKQERDQIIQDFRDKKIQILCNVDLISEGFDVPDCHCCILLRPTQSTALYIQQATRALRPSPNKEFAIIIDHVANYLRHSLPTITREWSLDKKIKKPQLHNEEGDLLVRQCTTCFATFKTQNVCPYCGTEYRLTASEIKVKHDIELQQIETLKKEVKLLKRQKKEQKRQFKEKLELALEPKIRQYTSYTHCNSLQELKIFCKINELSHKQFVRYGYMLGFLKK